MAAAQRISEAELLAFPALGQVTILHMRGCHAQLVPVYFREPSINVGVGDAQGLPPHLTGMDYLAKFGIEVGSHLAYAPIGSSIPPGPLRVRP